MLSLLWLIPAGIAVGAFGTLVGAGGGFILTPLLLLLYPDESPGTITSISLAVVFLNALSGSVAYARMGRIDYRSGILLSAATVPGAILGALTTTFMPRRVFDIVFGVVMVAASAFLIARPEARQRAHPAGRGRRGLARVVVDRDGTRHEYTFNPVTGVLLSLGVGYFSSVLGIGGGIIHVPILVQVLSFPVHIATATSQFTLGVMALAGTGVHVANGAFSRGIEPTIALGIGVLLGAQLGAMLSRRVHGKAIVRGLGTALGLVGVRVLIAALRL